MISVGLSGKLPIDDLLRLGGDFFFALNLLTEIHSSTTASGYREIGVKLLALESIEPLGDEARRASRVFR